MGIVRHYPGKGPRVAVLEEETLVDLDASSTTPKLVEVLLDVSESAQGWRRPSSQGSRCMSRRRSRTPRSLRSKWPKPSASASAFVPPNHDQSRPPGGSHAGIRHQDSTPERGVVGHP